MTYLASPERYNHFDYRRCGQSGLRLPPLSLGLWHNFGSKTAFSTSRALIRTAFDQGINHFDLANNYGPPPGSAETTFGQILRRDLLPYRDEILVSTKAGYIMGQGPYQDGGSRKYLLSSLDASLQRMGLDYVDIFYHHRPDASTPLEETMGALSQAVRSGRALYVAFSNYPPELMKKAVALLDALGTPCLAHQPKYSLFERGPETSGLFETLSQQGLGSIVFSPLAQGLLTDRYLRGIPADSRAGSSAVFLKPEHLTAEKMAVVRRLDQIARNRGQSLSQMALSWVLRPQAQHQVTSAIIGASQPSQILENLGALRGPQWTTGDLALIESAFVTS